jgi:hypothetical protein
MVGSLQMTVDNPAIIARFARGVQSGAFFRPRLRPIACHRQERPFYTTMRKLAFWAGLR